MLGKAHADCVLAWVLVKCLAAPMYSLARSRFSCRPVSATLDLYTMDDI